MILITNNRDRRILSKAINYYLENNNITNNDNGNLACILDFLNSNEGADFTSLFGEEIPDEVGMYLMCILDYYRKDE